MADAFAEEKVADLIERLSSYHMLRNENPTLIPEMALGGGEAKIKSGDGAVPVKGGGSAI